MDEDFMDQLLYAEANGGAEDAFDYNKHIAMLMRNAESEDLRFDLKGGGKKKDLDWMFESTDDEEDENNDALRDVQRDETRPIDEHFDAFLNAGYDSDDIGELEGDPNVDEDVLEQNDEFVDSVFTQHVDAIASEISEGKRILNEGRVNPTDVDDTIPDEAQGVDEARLEREMSVLWQSEGRRERWDAETILSTYSVTDNLPSEISLKKKRKKKIIASSLEPIELESEEGDDDLGGASGVNKGSKRDKSESKDEKKARKRAIKEERRRRREEKKSTKNAFKEAAKVQSKAMASSASAHGLSTFTI